MKKMNIFKINNSSATLYTIICVFTGLVAVGLCFVCTIYPDNAWWGLVKDIAVIVSTTFAVSVLIGLLIEKRGKEDFYIDLVNDTINSETFTERLTTEEKKEIFKNINKNFRCNGNKNLFKIYSEVEEKFVEQNFIKQQYYIVECRYDIICRVTEKYIQKEVTETMSIKSYEEQCKLKELVLGGYSNKFYGEEKSFELVSLKIGNEEIGQSEREKYFHEKKYESVSNEGPLMMKNGYNNRIICTYDDKNKLNLSSTKPLNVSYKYITRTDVNDNISTVRCSKPCKEFSVNFSVENEDYEAKAAAFGFIDNAKNSPDVSNKKRVLVTFKNYILPQDGVVIILNRIKD